MADSFFERPILNSPYEVARRRHALDDEGQLLDMPPIEGRPRVEVLHASPEAAKSQEGAAPHRGRS